MLMFIITQHTPPARIPARSQSDAVTDNPHQKTSDLVEGKHNMFYVYAMHVHVMLPMCIYMYNYRKRNEVHS